MLGGVRVAGMVTETPAFRRARGVSGVCRIGVEAEEVEGK